MKGFCSPSVRSPDASFAGASANSSRTYTPGLSTRLQGVSIFQHSGLKNVDAQSGAGGGMTGAREYDAFGNVILQQGAHAGPFGYAGAFGYHEDAFSGLKQVGHRYYDPEVGRFLTRDPIQSGRNWFVYCENRPLDSSDPTGLDIYLHIWWGDGGKAVSGSHAGLSVDWPGKPGNQKYTDFGPGVTVGFPGFIRDEKVPGVVSLTGKVREGQANVPPPDETIRVPLTPEQDRKVRQLILLALEASEKGNLTYQGQSLNCSDYIFLLLYYGDVLGGKAPPVLTPRKLKELLEGLRKR